MKNRLVESSPKPPSPSRAAAAIERAGASENIGIFWEPATEADDAAGSGPLAGEILAVKDCFDVAGLRTTCGVRGSGRTATRDAAVVAELRRAGAIVVGKASMDQLGWTMAGLAPGFPPCPNPRFPDRIPGGSSAGPAAAVAAGIATLGLGTDTAGSVRIPATYCGLAGVCLAPGMVETRGLAAVAPSLESVGLIARSIDDCRRGLRALGLELPAHPPSKLRIGRLEDLFAAAGPETMSVCDRAAEVLGEVADVESHRLDWKPPGIGRLLAAELDRTWGPSIAADESPFSADVRASAEIGREIDEDELTALHARLALERERISGQMARFDVVASPCAVGPPPKLGQGSVREASMLTRPFNALGWPAVTIPVGPDRDGFPAGLQLAAPPDRLGSVLSLAKVVEERASEQGSAKA